MALDYVTQVRWFLNHLANLGPKTNPHSIYDPQEIEKSVAHFCALEIYLTEGLGLLDKFTCTSVTIKATLEDDSYLQGSATISGSASGSAQSFQTGLFTYRPVDKKGNPEKYTTAPCGELTVITHTGFQTTFECDVISSPDGRKKLKLKEYEPKNPSTTPREPSYEEERGIG
jgi:hypothetical protein